MKINWVFFQTAPWWKIALVVVCVTLFVGMIAQIGWMLYEFATYKIDREWWKHLNDESPREDA